MSDININDVNNAGDFFLMFMQEQTFSLIGSKYPDLIASMHTLLVVTLTFSLVIYGIRFMMAEIASTGKQLLITVCWVLIGLVLVEKGNYLHFVINPIQQVPSNLAAFFMGDEYAGQYIFSAVNGTFSRVFDYAFAIADTGGITTYMPYLAAAAIFILYGVYYALFLVIILFAQLSVSIFLLFGGVIIPISGFKICRGLFKSWLTAILKYSLVIVIVSIIIALIASMTDSVVLASTTIDEKIVINSKQFAALLLCGFLGGFLMLKSLEIVAEITGGVSTDMGGSLRTLGGAAKQASSALKMGGQYGAPKGLKALKVLAGKN